MFLSQVRVENFRGIRRLRLDLDHTTVLVGENSFGKSNLLSALDLVLGARARGPGVELQPSDLHVPFDGPRDDLGPLRIELRFRERSEGEWNTPSLDPMRPVMVELKAGNRGIRLRALAEHDGSGLSTSTAFLDEQHAPLPAVDHGAVLDALRRLNPVVVMGTGPSSAAGPPTDDPANGSVHPDVARLRGQIRHLFRKLVAREIPPTQEEVESGLAAVREVLERRPELLAPTRGPRRQRRDLVLAPLRIALSGQPLNELDHGTGSSIANLGPLVMLGALMEAMAPAGLHPGARPLVAIEDAEAHLHPITLASTWGLIDRIKAQRIVTTNSPELLAAVPLGSIRRLVRRNDHTDVFRLRRRSLSTEELRRVGYHVRMRRGGAFFARAWLLIEGETEAWLLPELARLAGEDFQTEGVHCLEIAQCGVTPLVKLANDLGIPWHLLCDGDSAGSSYANAARAQLAGAPEVERITQLRGGNIERCLWDHGYEHVYRRYLPQTLSGDENELDPQEAIARAARARRKPQLALEVIEEASTPGSPGVPWPLREVVDAVVRLARESIEPGNGDTP